MSIIDIILSAIPAGFQWLTSTVDIILKATPAGFGPAGLSILMLAIVGFFIIFIMSTETE